ncbi:DUF6934 family protein [Dyadobacter sp. CY343]|uniref:DUF6934 family protein n=1 Tax=Dyadobacter sp. CY343 TaxID=2907299 RepID=UPI0038D423E2
MKHHYYPFEASLDYLSFDFVSCSESRKIRKRVEFVPIGAELYNLAFGDVNTYNDIDDQVITNNRDMEKVLSTVIHIIYVFLSVFPSRVLYFEGSTQSRTRLYQIVLKRERTNWGDMFEVYGMAEGRIRIFDNCINFESFLIKRRNHEEVK